MKVNESSSGKFSKLKKDLNSIQSGIWAQSVCRALKIRYEYSNVTTELLASNFPTTEAIRQEKFGDATYLKQLSVQYWARVLAGERGVKDRGLIQRVNKQLGISDQALSSPLCAVLKKPQMRSADYRGLIDTLSPVLENRVFTAHPQNRQLKQSPCYWSWKNIDLIYKEEFLAYQILLLNQRYIKSNGPHKYLSLKQLVLYFWRFLLTTPFGMFSEPLCESLIFYLQENHQLKRRPGLNDCKSNFEKLRYIAYPQIKKFPAYTDSYEAYLAHNRKVCEAAEYRITAGKGSILSSAAFHKETLYFADRYADQWMKSDYEKASLFSKERPEYSEIVLTRNFHKTHRIW